MVFFYYSQRFDEARLMVSSVERFSGSTQLICTLNLDLYLETDGKISIDRSRYANHAYSFISEAILSISLTLGEVCTYNAAQRQLFRRFVRGHKIPEFLPSDLKRSLLHYSLVLSLSGLQLMLSQ